MSENKKIELDEGCIFDGWRGIYIPANVILLAYDHGFTDDAVDPIVAKHFPDGNISAYDIDEVERDIADLEFYLEIFESAENYLSGIVTLKDNCYLVYNDYSGDWGVWCDDETGDDE